MNNRTIKFRAWDKEDKKMSPNWYALNILRSMDEGKDRSKKVIMQFAGLYDKNGKEIYEGDIFKHYLDISELKFGHYSYEDEYGRVHGTGFYCADIKTHEFKHEFGEGYDGEVLGNIYENPELLSKEES